MATATTPDSVTAERVPWDAAVTRMDWSQGEHVTLIGPTGVGKTELMIELLKTPIGQWSIFLSTKRIDSTIAPLKRMGYHTIHTSRELNPEVRQRVIVAPKWNRKIDPSEQDANHAEIFAHTLTRAFWQTGWTIAIDELEYINRDLNVVKPVNRLLRQGRSQGNTMILGTQRPRHVTLHAYEQATHLFLWKQSDMSNVERAAELTGLSKRDVVTITRTLSHHDVLYVQVITGEMFITNTRW